MEDQNRDTYENFRDDDTRYYGVFIEGEKDNRDVKIDLHRFISIFDVPESLKVFAETRNERYLTPTRREYLDYNLNFAVSTISEIRKEWNDENKLMINNVLSKIESKDFAPYDDELACSGILEADEAWMNARMKTVISHQIASEKRNRLFASLYAQFFHQMASKIEALTVKILDRNGYKGGFFNRNIFLTFNGNFKDKLKEKIGYLEYDKLYSIWNFIKHNSISAYKKLKKGHPEVLGDQGYQQGDLACFYVNFSDELIESLLNGVELFLKQYCQVVLLEDEQEVSWNYNRYFTTKVYDEIELILNPLGLPDWL